MRDDFTASLRSACSLRHRHFVSYLRPPFGGLFNA
ncbi:MULTISPECIES: gluconate 5-dehydrogenase [Yersinia]|nr:MULTISPECIES: gluconate 5-dehydrogenase [Yersinia]